MTIPSGPNSLTVPADVVVVVVRQQRARALRIHDPRRAGQVPAQLRTQETVRVRFDEPDRVRRHRCLVRVERPRGMRAEQFQDFSAMHAMGGLPRRLEFDSWFPGFRLKNSGFYLVSNHFDSACTPADASIWVKISGTVVATRNSCRFEGLKNWSRSIRSKSRSRSS